MQLPTIVLVATAAVTTVNVALSIYTFIQFRKYQKRQRELLSGEGSEVLTDIVAKHKKLLQTHNKNLIELGKILEELVGDNKQNIQKIGVVRFNPFAETGGNMSFVVALLNARQSGIVISSLHSREGTRIYAKPVENGASPHHLTEEEKEAIKQAK